MCGQVHITAAGVKPGKSGFGPGGWEGVVGERRGSSMGCRDPGAIGSGDIVSKVLLPDSLPSPQGKGTSYVDG